MKVGPAKKAWRKHHWRELCARHEPEHERVVRSLGGPPNWWTRQQEQTISEWLDELLRDVFKDPNCPPNHVYFVSGIHPISRGRVP